MYHHKEHNVITREQPPPKLKNAKQRRKEETNRAHWRWIGKLPIRHPHQLRHPPIPDHDRVHPPQRTFNFFKHIQQILLQLLDFLLLHQMMQACTLLSSFSQALSCHHSVVLPTPNEITLLPRTSGNGRLDPNKSVMSPFSSYAGKLTLGFRLAHSTTDALATASSRIK